MSDKKWEVFCVPPIAHVVPTYDTARHWLVINCDCKPRVQEVEGGTIYIHNSYDHREICEMENE